MKQSKPRELGSKSSSQLREMIKRDSRFSKQLNTIVKDRRFRNGIEKLDVTGLSNEFKKFTEQVTTYNSFHREERKLWAVKIREGKIAPDVDSRFRAKIPKAIEDYRGAFRSMVACLEHVKNAELWEVVKDRIAPIATTDLLDEGKTLGKMVKPYIERIGVDEPMIRQFRTAFGETNHNLVETVAGGEFRRLQSLTEEGVNAQVSILEYSKEHGLDYIKGRCGPPAWAVWVSTILAAAGISISAWVVVIIIVALVAILASICLAVNVAAWIKSACASLAGMGIPVLIF